VGIAPYEELIAMNHTAYLFDFDYTLAFSEPGIVACYRHVLDLHGHRGISDHEICRTIGHTVSDSFGMLCGERDDATLKQYYTEFVLKADEVMVDMTVLYPEAVDAIKRLRSRGLTAGIVSTKLRRRIVSSLERYDLAALVDVVIGGDDVSAAKPDPEGVLLAIKHLGAEKSGVLYIGDSVIDAETAKNAGVDFAAVLTGATEAREFDGFPYTRIMKDLGELI
jgi:phosphoglycolate phosphatase